MNKHHKQIFLEEGIRLRFHIESAYTKEELVAIIKSNLAKEDAVCTGRAKDRYATLLVSKEDRHYWSPQLSLTFEDDDEQKNTCLIRGVYGPAPSVWTMFVFFYSLIGFLILIIGVMGLSNMSLGKSSSILWFVPILVVVFFSLYMVSYFGQNMGKEQMIVLHRFFKECLKEDPI